MRVRQWVCSLAIVLAVPAVTAAMVACGATVAKFPEVKGTELPAGESWEGVYYNPVYGHLHLVPQGDTIVGRWKRTDSSHWGELSGTVQGNVFHFTWTEHRYGAFGPSADTHGSGMFVYRVPPQKDDSLKPIAELDGKYALDESTEIGDWHCVKQLNFKPDLKTINGENPVDPAAKDQWQ